jgi:hypothetical protein
VSVKAKVDEIVATPSFQLGAVFPPFQWTFGKVRRRPRARALERFPPAAFPREPTRRFLPSLRLPRR